MSAIWSDWWQGRALRAERDADRMGMHLENLLCSWGPSIAEWSPGKEAVRDWGQNMLCRGRCHGAGDWSERAQRAEQDADRLAQVLQAIDEHHPLAYSQWAPLRDLLRDWVTHREIRYAALPAGHTLEGSLKSGGIEI